jgi:hypothetical protein
MNRYAFHVYVIPEDDRDRQIADGFVLHDQVNDTRIRVMPPAGGWAKVLETFRVEYVAELRQYPSAHVIMLIDFDDRIDTRKADFEHEIPAEFKTRVFVVGPKDNPETLKKALKINFEEIGKFLAHDCYTGTAKYWDHEQLEHNDAERQRLVQTVKPFLF